MLMIDCAVATATAALTPLPTTRCIISTPLHQTVGEGCVHNVSRISLSFGAYITASLYVPCATVRSLEPCTCLSSIVYILKYKT